LPSFRPQEVFVDVTLACGGKLYPAHKFVLSTCSEYFREMFTKNPCKHPIVFMKDVSGRDLEALLDFMYRGEVNVPQTHLASLIKTAEGLQVKGLAVPDEQQQLNPSYIRRPRELSTPRPPPAPSVSPPPKRKRMKEGNYTPVGALSMMYRSMSPQEPNSPYDLSQKSSSSSSVSQSDAVHNDRIRSMSPDQPPPHPHPHPHPHQQQQQQPPHQTHPQSSAPSSISSYHHKESSPEDARDASSTPDDVPPKRPRSPGPPRSITPPPPDSDPMPGPSGLQCKGEEIEEEEEPAIKEDLSMEEDDENDWGMGNGAGSDCGDTTSGGESIHHDCIPHNYSEASNSSLPTLDPALVSTVDIYALRFSGCASFVRGRWLGNLAL
ncbi:UNVERIFIED_CONTAM: hypothetical protein GTU68_012161, partial [Idotea baltica]|nr:hypothetical protein [Idotea baltica]